MQWRLKRHGIDDKNRDRMRTARAISHCTAALPQCNMHISRNGSPSSPFPTEPIQLSPHCTPDVAAVELKPVELKPRESIERVTFTPLCARITSRASSAFSPQRGCHGTSPRESINGHLPRPATGLALPSGYYAIKFMSNYTQLFLFISIGLYIYI